MAQGLLIIVSGPSGVGKGTICKELVERRPNLKVSISCTTRERRRNEEEGVHYFYKTEEEFNRMVMEGQLLEHAYVHGHQYGTPRPMWWICWKRDMTCCWKSTFRARLRP